MHVQARTHKAEKILVIVAKLNTEDNGKTIGSIIS